MKMKSTYEKPSERKKRVQTENIKRIKKLSGIKVSGKSVTIGATTKHVEVANSKDVKNIIKILVEEKKKILNKATWITVFFMISLSIIMSFYIRIE